jgi:hypothetical protein
MNIDNKIKEVAEYFKGKLLEGEFKFIQADDFRAAVEIDKHLLNIWIANGKWNLNVDNVGVLIGKYLTFSNEEEVSKIWGLINPLVVEEKKKLRLERLKRLKAEIEELED